LRFDDFLAASLDLGIGSFDDEHVELWFDVRPDRDATDRALPTPPFSSTVRPKSG